MTIPVIDNVYPVPDATGVVIGDSIKITFDCEMDETSVNTGTIVVTGPDNDFIFGPDYNPLDNPGVDEEDILSSPYTTGYVKGVLSFKRIDSNGDEVVIVDDSGDGTLYRTLATFTPSVPLEPNVLYTVLVAGDEDDTDDAEVGVSTRTVFDTINFSVTGSGQINFAGGYTGNTQTYVVEITTPGTPGTSEYIWWKESTPLDVHNGVTSTGQRDFEHGLYITCDPDGSFDIGDTFKVVVKAPERLEDNYKWSFTTSSGSILIPPSTSSTTGLSELVSAGLSVVSIEPEFRTTNLDPDSVTEIVVTFNKNLDPATVTDETVKVWTESVNGDPQFPAVGDLTKTLDTASNILTITIISSPSFYKNNVCFIELDKSIAATDGDTLEADTTYYFTTTYDPMYSALRRVQLDLGPLLSSIPDDTVNFAIFEASLTANANRFDTTVTNSSYLIFAIREYTRCLAELTLVRALLGDLSLTDRMGKTLGDLQVSRAGPDLKSRQERLEECVARWQVVLQTGGEVSPDTSMKPGHSVKGSFAEDAISIGRDWESTSTAGSAYQRPLANAYKQVTGRRWIRSFRKR